MPSKQQTIKVAKYVAVTFALGLGTRGCIYLSNKLAAINYTELVNKVGKHNG